jgi:hypothetical protein
MVPLGVVGFDPASQPSPQSSDILEFIDIDALIFERPPQPLDEDIAHPGTLAVHGELYLKVVYGRIKKGGVSW